MGQLESGQVAAAGVSDQVMADFARRRQLKYRVLAESKPYFDLAVMASPRISTADGEKVRQAFINMAGDPAGLPRRLAEHFVRQIDQRPVTAMSRMLDRSAGQPEVKEILLRYLEDVIVQPMIEQLDGPDARARALLASTIIMGGGPVRRLFGLEDKMRQYRDGAVFVRGVVADVGMDGFNQVWSSPETLPSPEEIGDPRAWVRRVRA